MDVAGSGDITNRPDNVMAIHRFNPEDKLTSEYSQRYEGMDSLLQVFKNRFDGPQGMEIGLCFNPDSKRFYSPNEPGALLKQYGWEYEKEYEQTTLGREVDIKCPWDEEEKG